MEIIFQDTPKYTKFRDIPAGTVFSTDEEGLFIKTEDGSVVVISPLDSLTAVGPGVSGSWEPNAQVFIVRTLTVELE